MFWYGYGGDESDSDAYNVIYTYRLLTLWFDYGQSPDIYDALVEGIKSIQIDNWIQVSTCTKIDTHR